MTADVVRRKRKRDSKTSEMQSRRYNKRYTLPCAIPLERLRGYVRRLVATHDYWLGKCSSRLKKAFDLEAYLAEASRPRGWVGAPLG